MSDPGQHRQLSSVQNSRTTTTPTAPKAKSQSAAAQKSAAAAQSTAAQKAINQGAAAVTIGNFDGAHVGHQQLWYKALSRPGSSAELPTLLTFEPHPRIYLGKKKPGTFLFTPEQKLRAAAEFGLQRTEVLSFNKELFSMSHHDFYQKVLVEQMAASSIVVGEDFCFGSKRLGSISYLRERSRQAALRQEKAPASHIVPPSFYRGKIISSSRLRQAIESGEDFGAITAMLGRPYLIEGVITEGKKLGRTIDIPTMNFSLVQQLIPAPGVYYGYIWRPGGAEQAPSVMSLANDRYPALINVGRNPTLDSAQPDQPLKIEAHALYPRWQDSLYGKRAGFYFLGKLREERKFGSLDELKAQIGKDIAWAKAHFIY